MKSKKRINFMATLLISITWGFIYFGALKLIELQYSLSPSLPDIPESQWDNPALSSTITFIVVLTFGRSFLVLKDLAFAKGAGIDEEEQFGRPVSSLAPVTSWPDGAWGWVKMIFGVLGKQAGETSLLVGGAGFEMLVGIVTVFAFYAGIDSPYMSTMMGNGMLILSISLICFGFATQSINIRGTLFWIPYPLFGLFSSLNYLFKIYWESNMVMFFTMCVSYLVLCLMLSVVSAFLYGIFTRVAISQEV